MKRRLLSIFLSLTMILSMVPSVWAADETLQDDTEAQETETPAKPAMNGNCGATEEDHVTWALTKNTDGTTYTLTISGGGAMADYAVGKAPAGSLCCTLRVLFSAKCQSHDIPARSRQVRCAILCPYFSSFLAVESEKDTSKNAKVALRGDFFSEIYRNHERNVV